MVNKMIHRIDDFPAIAKNPSNPEKMGLLISKI